MVANTADIQRDIALLEQLNADHLASDQRGDVEPYEELLAGDSMESLPDLRSRDKWQFLETMSRPRPFTDLKADDVRILPGDFASSTRA
jgi:hypothetical protein